uniref:Glutaredoxin n=1 Tax=Haliotis diversicolor supertexta TaxID=283615 RepID=E6Y2Z2_HALDV|nr:glutaredoxin [Haliotis diversicolor supertexta]
MNFFRKGLRNAVANTHCFVRFSGSYRTASAIKMSEVKQLVNSKIAGKKVMVFSKSSCPYCAKAKAVFKKYVGDILSEDEYEVMEIETNSKCGEIQDYLGSITGGRTVPRVFINGKFLGGGDETAAADRSGQLKSFLQA